MKRIISLLLVLLLTLSALFLVACDEDDKKDDGSETKPKVTQKVDDSDDDDDVKTTAAPQEPVAVASLNGKSAKQLVEKFIEEYSEARSFDMVFNMSETVDGETAETKMAFKITETEFWGDMTIDGEPMKVWVVDDVAYFESADGKFKAYDVSVEDIFGEGFFEKMMSLMPSEVDDEWAEQLDEAQLYYYKNAYYVTITVTDEEAEEMGLEAGYTQTIYFDKDENLRKIEIEDEESKGTMLINSYGKPLEIDPPENADEFLDGSEEEL